MDENKSFSDIIGPRGSTARRHAPCLNHLATVCGLATNYHGLTHPSHPNYMAITGGLHTAERLLGYRRYIGHADDPETTGMSRSFGL